MKQKRSIISVSQIELSHKTEVERKNDDLNQEECPLSSTKGKRVHRVTMSNHIYPKYWHFLSEDYNYFCPERGCPVIYFNNYTKSYFSQNELRSPVGHKMVIQAELRPICYCKGVLEKQILDELLVKQCCDSLKDIQEYTGANLGHDCKITNPSGRCCGSQIKELLNWAKKQKLLIHAPLLEEANSCCNAIIDKTKKKSTAI